MTKKKLTKTKKTIILICIMLIWIICNWCLYLNKLPEKINDDYFEKYKIYKSDLSSLQQDSELLKAMPVWLARRPISEKYEKTTDEISSEYFKSNEFSEDIKKLDEWVSKLPEKKLIQHTNHINNPTAFVINGKSLDCYLEKCVDVFPLLDASDGLSVSQAVRYISNVYRWCQALGSQYNVKYTYGGQSLPFEIVAHSRLKLLEQLTTKLKVLEKENNDLLKNDVNLKSELSRLVRFIGYEYDREDYAIEREQCLKAFLESLQLYDEKTTHSSNSMQKALTIEIIRLFPIWIDRRIAEYHKDNLLLIKNYVNGVKDPTLEGETLETTNNSSSKNVISSELEQSELISLKRKMYGKMFFSLFWAPLFANARAEYQAYTSVKTYGNKLRSLRYPELFAKVKDEILKIGK